MGTLVTEVVYPADLKVGDTVVDPRSILRVITALESDRGDVTYSFKWFGDDASVTVWYGETVVRVVSAS